MNESFFSSKSLSSCLIINAILNVALCIQMLCCRCLPMSYRWYSQLHVISVNVGAEFLPEIILWYHKMCHHFFFFSFSRVLKQIRSRWEVTTGNKYIYIQATLFFITLLLTRDCVASGKIARVKNTYKMPIKCLFYKFLSWCRRQFSMETYCIIT